MGYVSWPPPLPPTATREEMEADLAALRREIRRNNAMLGICMAGGIICGVVLGGMCLLLGQ